MSILSVQDISKRYKFEVRRFALDMAIFSIDDDVAGKVPDTVFEIEFACTALVGLDTDTSLR